MYTYYTALIAAAFFTPQCRQIAGGPRGERSERTRIPCSLVAPHGHGLLIVPRSHNHRAKFKAGFNWDVYFDVSFDGRECPFLPCLSGPLQLGCSSLCCWYV